MRGKGPEPPSTCTGGPGRVACREGAAVVRHNGMLLPSRARWVLTQLRWQVGGERVLILVRAVSNTGLCNALNLKDLLLPVLAELVSTAYSTRS